MAQQTSLRETTVNQPDDAGEDLLCLHDNTSVGGDDPQCLHPSSYCSHRTLCPILETQRERRRADEKEETETMK